MLLVSALAAVNSQGIYLALIVHNTSIIYLEAVIRDFRCKLCAVRIGYFISLLYPIKDVRFVASLLFFF